MPYVDPEGAGAATRVADVASAASGMRAWNSVSDELLPAKTTRTIAGDVVTMETTGWWELRDTEPPERKVAVAREPECEFAKKVAVVTGAGSGQGRATALRLARGGALIAGVDVDSDAVTSLSRELEKAGAVCLPFETDVSSPRMVAETFARIQDTLGPAYILAAAAGIFPPPRELVDLTPEQIERIFAVNVYGVFNCAREAARQMLMAGNGGRIVLWSSVAAQLAAAGHSAYCASKGAVEAMARVFAAELSPHGIYVNVISPGAIDTPMLAGYDLDIHESALPSRRVGQPDEVAELAAYLCSRHVGFVTGATVNIDGGLSAINGIVAAERLARPR